MAKQLKGYTMEVKQELADRYLAEGIRNLEGLGYDLTDLVPYVTLTNARSYFGKCQLKDGDIYISISQYHFNNGLEAVRSTIYHELIHAIGIWNHGEKFKDMACLFDELFDTNIQVSGSRIGHKLPKTDRQVRYILKCEKCGAVWRRKNRSKFVRNYHKYKCACGGKITMK